MKRALTLLGPALLLTACGSMDFGLTNLQDQLMLTAISGEEEDWSKGGGDFLGEASADDPERPELFRACDALGDFRRLVEQHDGDGDGRADEDGTCERGGPPPEDGQGGPPQGDGSGGRGDGGPPPEQGAEDSGGEPHEPMDRGHGGDERMGHMLHVLGMVYDTDGDGTLSDAELEVLFADFTERCEAIHEQLLEAFDADGDGALDETERAEAAAAVRELRELRREEQGAERPERGADPLAAEFDSDGDGTLSEDELAELRETMRERIRSGEPLGECHM